MMNSSIQLNFINNSNDLNNSEVIIFQKNVAATYFEDVAIAWQVIRYCGPGDNHPFTFSFNCFVGASDSYGNSMSQLPAQNGQLYQTQLTTSGDKLVPAGNSTNSKEIQVLNAFPKGAINASIYRDGKLLSLVTNIAPQQKAVFEFGPTIWIGVASQVIQGQAINTAIVYNINTELSLLGIASADIVMTGGGPGRTPFQFNLENVVMA